MNATLTKLTMTPDVAKAARALQREIKAMQRLRAKGHRDWKNATDEQIRAAAEAMTRIYAHNYVTITEVEV